MRHPVSPTALSAPRPPAHYVGSERATFAGGANEVLDYRKNELICFSDSAGTIMAIAVDAAAPGPGEVLEVGRVFQKEVDWRTELDEWNDKYKAQFGSIGENNVDDYIPAAAAAVSTLDAKEAAAAAAVQRPRPTLTHDQIKRKICDETFKWVYEYYTVGCDSVTGFSRVKLHTHTSASSYLQILMNVC